MHRQHPNRQFRRLPYRPPEANIAAVYNRAGDDYLHYADGDPRRLFAFQGPHAYADRRVWRVICKRLNRLRATGATSISVVDAGCGPGTWLRRVVTQARQLGFTHIAARGFDVADAQIQTARRIAGDLARLPGVSLRFDVADLTDRMPEASGSVDITLCLYSVLSHLPTAILPGVATEIARVTRGHLIATVRAIGSTPTIFIDSIDKARHFKLDHDIDRCEVEFRNGRRIALSFRLFAARELRDCFSGQFAVEDLRGLDIFHSRFLPDTRWNPASVLVDERLSAQLGRLEDIYARDPCLMERATHLLLVASRRHTQVHSMANQPARACTFVGANGSVD